MASEPGGAGDTAATADTAGTADTADTAPDTAPDSWPHSASDSASHSVSDSRPGSPLNSTLVRAARGLPVPHTPIWFMRQAGRSLPEYRAIRAQTTMLQACMDPGLITEITLQPVRRYGVDAAILFSDIVLPLKAVGLDVDIRPGIGPVVAEPIRSRAGLAAVRPVRNAEVGFITEAVTQLRAQLGGTPLIGFAGAPFTVASYLVEGGPSRDHAATKQLMYADPGLWHELAARLADSAISYLSVQLAAGATAYQLFDSWAGALSAADYAEFVLPHSARVFDELAHFAAPALHFGVNTGELLALFADAGADVVGVDWRVGLGDAAARIAAGGRTPKPVQGNLDPALLGAPIDVLHRVVGRILAAGKQAPGHIFNLGHGVPKEADPDVLAGIVRLVQESTRAS